VPLGAGLERWRAGPGPWGLGCPGSRVGRRYPASIAVTARLPASVTLRRPPDGRAFEVIGCHKAFQRNGTGSLARVETLPWYGAARPSLGAW